MEVPEIRQATRKEGNAGRQGLEREMGSSQDWKTVVGLPSMVGHAPGIQWGEGESLDPKQGLGY